MPYSNDTIAVGAGTSAEFPRFGSDAVDADYGVLLTRLMNFLSGEITEQVPGSNTGDGKIHSLAVTAPSDVELQTFTLDFYSSTQFVLTGTSSGASPPTTLVNGSATLTLGGVTLTVSEGQTAFANLDSFAFNTYPTPLPDPQGYQVIVDTARGFGSTLRTSVELMKYRRTGGGVVGDPDVAFRSGGPYSTDAMASNGTFGASLAELKFYDQVSLNQKFYIDFHTDTQYKLKDSSGTILATGTVGEFLEYHSPAFSVGITVAQAGTIYFHTAAASAGVPELDGGEVKQYSNDPAGTSRTCLEIRPSVNTVSADTRVTRIVVLKATGMVGADSMYFTILQRVGGTDNRWYLDCHMHRAYTPTLGVFSQTGMSPAGRIANQQGNPLEYYLIGDGRCFKVLTTDNAGGYQMLMAGFLLPHSTPTSFPFPAFVAGTLGNGLLTPEMSDAPAHTDNCPGFNPGARALSPADEVGFEISSTLWVALPPGGWAPGRNRSTGSLVDVSPPLGTDLNDAASGFDSVYTSPWLHRQGASDGSDRRSCRISCNAYGDPAVKFVLPGVISFGGAAGSQVWEFPGVFFVGQSNTASVDRRDTIDIDSVVHVVWAGTNTPSSSAAVLAAFSLE